MRRRLLHLLTTLSLVMCVAMGVLWVNRYLTLIDLRLPIAARYSLVSDRGEVHLWDDVTTKYRARDYGYMFPGFWLARPSQSAHGSGGASATAARDGECVACVRCAATTSALRPTNPRSVA